jgi:predicted phosphodiesterase
MARNLRSLPLRAEIERCGKRFHLIHAMPSNPLYGRCPPNGEQWIDEIEAVSADILLVGHTHVPYIRMIGDKVLLNPGSIGQPRAGGSLASYAVWWNGEFDLRTFRYPIEATIKKAHGTVATATGRIRGYWHFAAWIGLSPVVSSFCGFTTGLK